MIYCFGVVLVCFSFSYIDRDIPCGKRNENLGILRRLIPSKLYLLSGFKFSFFFKYFDQSSSLFYLPYSYLNFSLFHGLIHLQGPLAETKYNYKFASSSNLPCATNLHLFTSSHEIQTSIHCSNEKYANTNKSHHNNPPREEEYTNLVGIGRNSTTQRRPPVLS